MTTDLNDGLKLVTEQGAGGRGYMVCLSALLPDQEQNVSRVPVLQHIMSDPPDIIINVIL